MAVPFPKLPLGGRWKTWIDEQRDLTSADLSAPSTMNSFGFEGLGLQAALTRALNMPERPTEVNDVCGAISHRAPQAAGYKPGVLALTDLPLPHQGD